MELRQLKTFRTVATLLHFNRAAELLNMAQSTVSAQIQVLEEELGTRLFERMNRRIVLTPAGERLLRYAGKLLDLEEEARGEVAMDGFTGGSLTIRVPETLCGRMLPKVIKRFHDRYPKIKLHFTTCSYHNLSKDLAKGVTDLAFLLADSFQAPGLQIQYLGTCDLLLVAPPDHRLCRADRASPQDLAGETLLLSRTDCSYRQMFQRLLAEAGVDTVSIMELNSLDGIRACVAAGVGLSVLPRVVVEDDLAKGRIAEILFSEGPLEVAILMIWHLDKWISVPLAAFMDLATECLSRGAPGAMRTSGQP